MDESTHLATLRKCLAQCEEALPEIHDHHDRQIMEEHAELLRADIRRMEEWEKNQEAIRVRNEIAYSNGAPCGGV
jgi:DNA repair exonuclease SbcCD ATPase subunit